MTSMDKDALIAHWKLFFKDLFFGTLKRILLFTILGFLFGVFTTLPLETNFIQTSGLSEWLQWFLFIIALIWYAVFGAAHGLIASIIFSVDKKLREMIGGLQGIFDFFSRAAIKALPKGERTYSKEEMEQKFELIGQEFIADLKLKGLIGILSSLLFAFILKGLKFLFIDEVAEKVLNKPEKEVTSADIEAAIRRVGVETLLSPIHDQFLLLQIINIIILTLTFGLPFFLFWIF